MFSGEQSERRLWCQTAAIQVLIRSAHPNIKGCALCRRVDGTEVTEWRREKEKTAEAKPRRPIRRLSSWTQAFTE
jgi:hypothetical protein